MNLDGEMWARLAVQIAKIHEKNKKSNRGWLLKPWTSTIPFQFDFSIYNQSNYDSMWQMNIDLHDAMNEYWSEIKHDTPKLNEFATWVVKDWGGIAGNDEDTIQEYCAKSFTPWLLIRNDGVASYSKILSAKDRKRFFILDGRVAATLNVLQLLFPRGRKLYFDLADSTNQNVKNFNAQYKKTHFKNIGYEVSNRDIYAKYNDIIIIMSRELRISGIEVEMMLFDNAVSIVSNTGKIDDLFRRNIVVRRRRALKDREKTADRLKSQGYNVLSSSELKQRNYRLGPKNVTR